MDTRDNPETTADCTECLLRSITNYAELHTKQREAWILLYCYYKQFKYEPGCAFARWRFEDQQSHGSHLSSSSTPRSMWGIFVTLNPNFPTARGYLFYDVFQCFVRLGLYEFAQVVFATVENQCDEADRYMIKTQMAVLLNAVDEDFELQTFDFGEGEQAEKLVRSYFEINFKSILNSLIQGCHERPGKWQCRVLSG